MQSQATHSSVRIINATVKTFALLWQMFLFWEGSAVNWYP